MFKTLNEAIADTIFNEQSGDSKKEIMDIFKQMFPRLTYDDVDELVYNLSKYTENDKKLTKHVNNLADALLAFHSAGLFR